MCKSFNTLSAVSLVRLFLRSLVTTLPTGDLLAKVYINLLDQKEPKLNFSSTNEGISFLDEGDNSEYCKKVINPTLDELKSHADFLKTHLKKNYF